MSEMIERVTDAISRVKVPIMRGEDMVGVQYLPRPLAAYVARAAIAAMREPTAEMVNAMETSHDYRFEAAETFGTIPIRKEQCAEIYTAMIDAAL